MPTYYRNCTIVNQYATGTQPDAWAWQHEDYDGPPSPLCGYARTLLAAKMGIDEVLAELEDAPPFGCNCHGGGECIACRTNQPRRSPGWH